ncbi:MAG: TetR/AcrR family transcriptional regulator [Aestuariivita sp.]|nr:TetR/AcrR family transcriptional regulator [Aestuariivita sp.]
MDQRHHDIVQTAFRLFSHYGVSKTSMTDVATASNVARQTLYNAFDSKEDLIYAGLLHYAQQARDKISQECAEHVSPGERLDVLFQHLVAIPFEAMQSLPHLDEVLEIASHLPKKKCDDITQTYIEAIHIVLAPYRQTLTKHGINYDTFCIFLKGTLTQLKRDADNPDQLSDLCEVVKSVLLVCIDKP